MGTRAFLGVVTALLAALMLTFSPADPDLWWHLSNGREMVQQGQVLTHDVFSHTRFGERWVNVFWLPDLLLYGLYCLGGYFALALVPPCLGALVFGLLWWEREEAPFLRSFLVLVAAAAAAPFWALRPQLFSYLFLVLLHRWLREHTRPFRRIPLLFLVWGNVHGGFIWGFLLLLAWVVGGLIEGALRGLQAQDKSRAYLFSFPHLTPSGCAATPSPLLTKGQERGGGAAKGGGGGVRLNSYSCATLSGRGHSGAWVSACDVWALAGATLASALAVLVNPNGVYVWMLPFHTVRVSLGIQEWHSPDFHQAWMHPVLWLLFLYVVGLALAPTEVGLFRPWADGRPVPTELRASDSGPRTLSPASNLPALRVGSWPAPTAAELLSVLGFAYMGFVSQRALGPFVVVAAPYILDRLAAAGERMVERIRGEREVAGSPLTPTGRARPALNLALVALLALGVLGRVYALSRPAEVEKNYPVGAVEWIRAHRPPGPLFNSYNWGGYLTWTLPEYPVFIDGRADLYGGDLIGQWWEVVNAGPKHREVLDRWGVRLILLEPDHPIVQRLPAEGWRVLYQDQMAVVLGR